MAQNRAEQGSILIFLVASVTLLAGAIVGLLTIEMARAGRARTEVERTMAFTIAESGIDHARVLLGADRLPPSGRIDWSDDGDDNDGDGLVEEGDESMTATVERWWSDLEDNDGDGEIDESDENVARVFASARVGTSTETVTGWLERLDSFLPVSVPAVLTLLDPNSDISFAGNSFQINGKDHPLNNQTQPGPSVLGIATSGTPSQLIAQLSGQQLDNVTGSGGYPSVAAWAPPSSTWFDDLFTAMRPLANLVFTNYTQQYSGKLGNWRAGNYVITYSQGSLQVGGGATGAGVLLVDGDLTISGNFEYVGYIFVTGRIRVTGGGNGQTLRGAIFCGGDVSQTLASSLLDATLKGGIDLIYSSDALFRVRNAMTRYEVAAITEP
ncbi:MAG: hypothetical protein L0323_14205 [Planctomycetes bacterium]|nr:hypothetical protein [Planctomycetota bacterium]